MAGNLEKPPMAEQKPEEAQEAAPEMAAAEEEMSPEQMEDLEIANSYIPALIEIVDGIKEELAQLELLPDSTDMAERKMALEGEMYGAMEELREWEDTGEVTEIIEK